MPSPRRLSVCIHGHFYQPPRENPWLEEIEREPSATPFHDWNARIADECYTPNAWARVLDDDGQVKRLYNNYERLSFNFGPTLTSWLEREAPRTLDAIVAADARSVTRLGHGNALAQVYNHAILPLCNERDKRTQVRWGLRAFERTWGRAAEGMWLAETAVDQSTLDILAEEGVRFTILSPYQARRFRVDGDERWHGCAHGDIPSGRAYRHRTRSGADIALFFYDGGIARGIAFEQLLRDASLVERALRERGQSRHGTRDDLHPDGEEPWLVHTATDGESYGHHFRFGDMALAATFSRLESDTNVDLTNYGAFLASHGTRGEVELLEVSAWSCAHGVGRWERDCGCRMKHDGGWQQAWRTPLRQGLNALRDVLDDVALRHLGRWLRDPEAARDAYVDVVHDRRRTVGFLTEHAAAPLTEQDRTQVLTLLEMWRCSLLMFTSCGWFFDEVSGPEPIILMRYAARALSLLATVEPDTARRAQATLEATLGVAESNLVINGRRRTGAEVFREEALSAAVGPDRVALALALQSASPSTSVALSAAGTTTTMTPGWTPGCFTVVDHEEHAIDDAPVTCVTGSVVFEDSRTLARTVRTFAVVGLGGLDWRGVVCAPATAGTDRPEFLTPADVARAHRRHLEQRLRQAGDVADLIAVIESEAGVAFTLSDAPAELRAELAERALGRRLAVTDDVVAELLLSQRALLRGATGMGVTLAPGHRGLIAHALSHQAASVVRALRDPWVDVAPLARRLRTVVDDARSLGVTLSLEELEAPLTRLVTGELQAFVDEHSQPRATTLRPGVRGGRGGRDGVARLARLLDVLGSIPREGPLLEILRAGADLQALGRHDAEVADAAAVLLPHIDRLCRSRLAVSP